MFILETEKEHKWEKGRKKGRHKYVASSMLQVVSTEPDTGLRLTNFEVMT